MPPFKIVRREHAAEQLFVLASHISSISKSSYAAGSCSAITTGGAVYEYGPAHMLSFVALLVDLVLLPALIVSLWIR